MAIMMAKEDRTGTELLNVMYSVSHCSIIEHTCTSDR